jgi:hypothetical protein
MTPLTHHKKPGAERISLSGIRPAPNDTKEILSMRFTFRCMPAALLAAIALAGLVSGSASAAECPHPAKGFALCSGGKLQEGTFAFAGKNLGSVTLEEAGGLIKPITCTGETSKGQFVGTKSSLEVTGAYVELKGCSLEEHGCKVNSGSFFGGQPGVIILDGGVGTGTGPGLKGVLSTDVENHSRVTWSATSGSGFTDIFVSGCLQAGEMKVTGQQRCELPGSTIEALTHKAECMKTG